MICDISSLFNPVQNVQETIILFFLGGGGGGKSGILECRFAQVNSAIKAYPYLDICVHTVILHTWLF